MRFLVLLLLLTVCSAEEYGRSKDKCEKLSIPLCKKGRVKMVQYPNALGHTTQNYARVEANMFYPLIKIQCSPALKDFLCTVYAPPCSYSPNVIPPCRSLCEKARKGCLQLMRKFGFVWPDKLNCSRFPIEREEICLTSYVKINTTEPQVVKVVAPTQRNNVAATKRDGECETLSIPFCKKSGVKMVQYPSILGHTNQDKAGQEAHLFYPLVKVLRSRVLTEFLCAVYAPPCHTSYVIPPCRSLCEKALNACLPLMEKFGFLWPDYLNCDRFPVEKGKGEEMCLTSYANINTTESQVVKMVTPTEKSNVAATTKKVKCETLSIPMCKKSGVKMVQYPNALGETNQYEAGREAHMFYPLVKVECSPKLRDFLCTVYAPPCSHTSNVIPPCRDICEKARNGCLPLMLKFGFEWPAKLNCSRFPLHGDKICLTSYTKINSTEPDVVKKVTPTQKSNVTAIKKEVKCETLSIPMCKKSGVKMVQYPNALGETNQYEAGREAHMFYPLVKVECSPKLRDFLCTLYAPPCSYTPNVIPPCRGLCEKARSGCLTLMQRHGFEWPAKLNCSRFPLDGDKICLTSYAKINTTEPDVVKKVTPTQKSNVTATKKEVKCEALSIPLCKKSGVKMVQYPNALGETNQYEAGREAHMFYPLVKVECSPKLKDFLCTLYAPPCSHTPNVIPPCRDICEKARNGCLPLMQKFGFEWPAKLNCSRFPSHGDKICLTSYAKINTTEPDVVKKVTPTQKSNVTATKKEVKCETLSIPLCKKSGVKMVRYPNALGQTNQYEAGREAHMFYPLVKVECSPKLRDFLCTVYAPPCSYTTNVIPPCRDLCEKARNGCLTLMQRYGFEWPAKLNCSRFPLDGDKICLNSYVKINTTEIKVVNVINPKQKGNSSSNGQDIAKSSCKKAIIPLCKNTGVHLVKYPNGLGYNNQSDASRAVQYFVPYVHIECSPLLRDFICTAYAPPCSRKQNAMLPCRSLCEKVRKECLPVMREFGFDWPEELKCARFPSQYSGRCLNYYSSILETENFKNLTEPVILTETAIPFEKESAVDLQAHDGFCPRRRRFLQVNVSCVHDSNCNTDEKCCPLGRKKTCMKACKNRFKECERCPGGRRARHEMDKHGCRRCYCQRRCPKLQNCKLKCRRGYMRDSRGCRTCFCKIRICTHNTVCPPCPPGSRPSRRKNCRCRCETSCPRKKCRKCPLDHYPSRSRIRCRTCACLPCPMLKCRRNCRHGYRRNRWGCRTCVCKGPRQ